MKIYLDDIRPPYDNTWSLARNFDIFKNLILSSRKTLTHLSLDHDLGNENGVNLETGMDATKWFVELCIDEPEYQDYLQHIIVHSQNPVGVENIFGYFQSAKKAQIFNDILIIERKPAEAYRKKLLPKKVM